MDEQQYTLPQGDWRQPALGAGLAFAGSIPQLIEANRLKKERAKLMQQGAPGLSAIEQGELANARARAASSLAPGYAQEMEGIAQQQGDVLGAAKKAGIGGSNLLNTLSRLNLQGQAARRNLAIRGAQAQRASQEDLQNLAMTADARRQQRVQNWEAKMAAMDAARRQGMYSAYQSPFQGAMAFMPPGGIKFGGGAKNAPTMTTPSVTSPTQTTKYNPAGYGNVYGAKDMGYESTIPFPDLYRQ